MKALFSSFLLSTTFLFAQQTPAGSREMSAEAALQFAEELQLEKESQSTFSLEESAGFFLDSSYLGAYHWITAMVDDDLEIEDSSIWQLDNWQGAVNDWQTDDLLIITQNPIWYSSYRYRIINRNVGSSVGANLGMAPDEGSEFSLFITAIDPIQQEVSLSDGTQWSVSNRDKVVLSDWLLEDTIIVGFNSGWDSSKEHILINANLNNFIRAQQL